MTPIQQRAAERNITVEQYRARTRFRQEHPEAFVNVPSSQPTPVDPETVKHTATGRTPAGRIALGVTAEDQAVRLAADTPRCRVVDTISAGVGARTLPSGVGTQGVPPPGPTVASSAESRKSFGRRMRTYVKRPVVSVGTSGRAPDVAPTDAERESIEASAQSLESRGRKYELNIAGLEALAITLEERRAAGTLTEAEIEAFNVRVDTVLEKHTELAGMTVEHGATVDDFNRRIDKFGLGIAVKTRKTISETLAEPSAELVATGMEAQQKHMQSMSSVWSDAPPGFGGGRQTVTGFPVIPGTPGSAEMSIGTLGIAGATIVGAPEAIGIELARFIRPESVANLRPALTTFSAFTVPEYEKYRVGAIIGAPIVFGLEAAALSPVFKALKPVTTLATKPFRYGGERLALGVAKRAPRNVRTALRQRLSTVRVRRAVPIGTVEVESVQQGENVVVSLSGKFKFIPKGKTIRVAKDKVGEFMYSSFEALSPEKQVGQSVREFSSLLSASQKILSPAARVLPKRLRETVWIKLGSRKTQVIRRFLDDKSLEITRVIGKIPGTKTPAVGLKTVVGDKTSVAIRSLYPVKTGGRTILAGPRGRVQQYFGDFSSAFKYKIRPSGEELLGKITFKKPNIPGFDFGEVSVRARPMLPRGYYARSRQVSLDFLGKLKPVRRVTRLSTAISKRSISAKKGFKQFSDTILDTDTARSIGKLTQSQVSKASEKFASDLEYFSRVKFAGSRSFQEFGVTFKSAVPKGEEITRKIVRGSNVVGQQKGTAIVRSSGRVPFKIRPSGFYVKGKGALITEMSADEFQHLITMLKPVARKTGGALRADIRGMLTPQQLKSAGTSQRYFGDVSGFGFGFAPVYIPVESSLSSTLLGAGTSIAVSAKLAEARGTQTIQRPGFEFAPMESPMMGDLVVPVSRADTVPVQGVQVAPMTQLRIATPSVFKPPTPHPPLTPTPTPPPPGGIALPYDPYIPARQRKPRVEGEWWEKGQKVYQIGNPLKVLFGVSPASGFVRVEPTQRKRVWR